MTTEKDKIDLFSFILGMLVGAIIMANIWMWSI